MSADLFHQRFNDALKAGCNFAAIRLPETGDAYFFYATANPAMRRIQFQQHDRPIFYCSPYGAANKAYMLVSDAVYKNDECIFGAMPETSSGKNEWHYGSNTNNGFADETQYTTYVNNIIKHISKDEFDKVVAARCEQFDFKKAIDAAELFTKACEKYPAACVYFFSTLDAGTWFGASPEQLVAVKNNVIETAAIAGTLPANEPDTWTDKEYDEQGMISFFIENVLSDYGLKNSNQQEVETLVAGNVKHLHTKFKVKAKPDFLEAKFHKLLNDLNPTPAVCGLPQFEASLFISQHEKMERRFYSGFNGIQFPDGSLNLFVNLRCTELFNDHALLYAGAGITQASVAENEWEETKRKLNTMKVLLD